MKSTNAPRCRSPARSFSLFFLYFAKIKDHLHFTGDPKHWRELSPKRNTAISAVIFTVFFLSGVAALIYQIVWQRVLFGVYGIDTISVTIVITAFMLGLGIGAMIGGQLSRRWPKAALPLFASFELSIGLWGCLSLELIAAVAGWTRGVDHTAAGLIVFVLILIPTALMGATLPLLVGYQTERTSNVGRSVSNLYFSNTLGAAAGAFVTAGYLLGAQGLSGSVYFAAALNLSIAAAILGLLWVRRSSS